MGRRHARPRGAFVFRPGSQQSAASRARALTRLTLARPAAPVTQKPAQGAHTANGTRGRKALHALQPEKASLWGGRHDRPARTGVSAGQAARTPRRPFSGRVPPASEPLFRTWRVSPPAPDRPARPEDAAAGSPGIRMAAPKNCAFRLGTRQLFAQTGRPCPAFAPAGQETCLFRSSAASWCVIRLVSRDAPMAAPGRSLKGRRAPQPKPHGLCRAPYGGRTFFPFPLQESLPCVLPPFNMPSLPANPTPT